MSQVPVDGVGAARQASPRLQHLLSMPLVRARLQPVLGGPVVFYGIGLPSCFTTTTIPERRCAPLSDEGGQQWNPYPKLVSRR